MGLDSRSDYQLSHAAPSRPAGQQAICRFDKPSCAAEAALRDAARPSRTEEDLELVAMVL